jgi:trigger factor
MAKSEEETPEVTEAGGGTAVAEVPRKLNLTVELQSEGPCRKQVQVRIPREDIDRLMNESMKEFVLRAQVPGFRPGRVPRKLVEKRFREDVVEQVKQRLLLQSLEQIARDNELNAISEPDIDLSTITIPETGDLDYTFSVEVRPQFELPDYGQLTVKRPVLEVTDEEVDSYLQRYLSQFGRIEPVDGPAQSGDLLIVTLEVTRNGERLLLQESRRIRIRPVLRFRDAEIGDFDKLMVGVTAGEKRKTQARISVEAPVVELRNETVDFEFTIEDIKRIRLPELTPSLLESLQAESAEELRKQIRDVLERQVTYQQRQEARRQILAQLTESTTWELPENLVKRQVENALRRQVLEMQQAGFTDEEIRARENELLQQQLSMTRQGLKEHFVLDKLANQEKISVSPEDIEMEIMYMAMRRGENPRRVRARLEKEGLIDNLEAQILERKAVDFLMSRVKFEDVPLKREPDSHVEGISAFACGHVEKTSAERSIADDDDDDDDYEDE